MRRSRCGIAGAVLLLSMFAGAASAQSWRYEMGVYGGYALRTTTVDASHITGGSDGLKFGPSWLVGAQLGVRPWEHLGIRANGAFSQPPFKYGSTSLRDNVKYYNISLSGDLLFPLKQPAAQFTATEFLPYVALGAGVHWVHPSGTRDGPLLDNVVHDGIIVTPVAGQNVNLRYEEMLMGLAGLGADIRLGRHFSLRAEVGDRLFKPPVDKVVSGQVVPPDIGKLTHELYGTLGLELLAGLRGQPPVAVVPPPTPPVEPATPPPPPPPPPPAERPVSVCVVDPAAADGMQAVNATFVPATGDTVVGDARQKLGEAFADRPALSSQDWYVRGAPLTFGLGGRAVQYMIAGTPRTVNPGDLAYIGMGGGVPLFADRTEAAPVLATPAAGRADLAQAAQRASFLTQLRKVTTLYAPLGHAGCVMQPLQLQEAVRKVRG